MWREKLTVFAFWSLAAAMPALWLFAILSTPEGGSRHVETQVEQDEQVRPSGVAGSGAASTASPAASDTVAIEPFAPDDVVSSREVELSVTRALDGARVGAAGRLGAPGVYPPVEWLAPDDGPARLSHASVADMTGEPVEWLEVLARGRHDGQDLGYWGEVEPTKEGHYALEMEAASALRVEVLSPYGSPAAGARVRLSRDVVGLVSESVEADEGGVAEFEPLPHGWYTLVVERAGALRETVRVEHVITDEPVTQVVALEQDRAVFGSVRDSRGRPVVGALVEVHVDPVLREDDLLTSVVSQVFSAPAARATFTDVEGLYVLDGLKKGTAYVVARGGTGAVGMSSPLDLVELTDVGPVDIELMGGVDLVVTVVGPDDEPVRGAWVEWRDEVTGGGRRDQTDMDGLVVVEQVPATAWVWASTTGWRSAQVRPAEPDEDGLVQTRLVLERSDARGDWRVRVTPPLRYAFDRIELVRQGEGSETNRCKVTPDRGDVYKVERCEQGPGWLIASTRDHGVYRWFGELEQGVEHLAPEPGEVRVEFSGRVPSDLARVRLRWREEGGKWRRAEHEPTTLRRDARAWSHRLFEGVYEIEAALDEDAWVKTVSVGQEGGVVRWELPTRSSIEVQVADRLGNAVRGAHVEVWRGGSLLGEAVTSGAGLASVAYEGTGSVRVLASHWSEGEGDREVEEGEREAALVLSEPLLSLTGANRETDRARLDEALGASLVADRGSWLVDVLDPESPAARAGIPRAARVVRARRRPWGVEVVFEVGGEETARVARVEPQRR